MALAILSFCLTLHLCNDLCFRPIMERPTASGIAATIATVMSVASTALGLYATYENQTLKRASDLQALAISAQSSKIADNDAMLRQRAEQRAQDTSLHDYTLAVYQKVLDALSKEDLRQQQVALALISTLPDAVLREQLSSAFQQAPTVTQEVRNQAQKIQTAASDVVAQQKRIQQDTDQRWAYDVFWCTANSDNQLLAARVQNILAGGPSRRVRLRDGWTTEMNARPGYQAKGLEIRAEEAERPQAEELKATLDKTTMQDFQIKIIKSPTPNYLSVFVCN